MVYQINLIEVIQKLQPKKVIGNDRLIIRHIVPIDEINNENCLGWCSQKNAGKLDHLQKGIVISPDVDFKINPNVTYLVFSNPRLAFKRFLDSFAQINFNHQIAHSAQIPIEIKSNKQLTIGHHVVIEESVKIGNNVVIGHNTVIQRGTIIGNNVRIGCNCTIGGSGFGYEKNESDQYEYIPQIGNVILEDNVEIGDNVCIDRAALGSTVLHRNVKVDNLVHIAHGCKIGENTLIIANAMIAGSTTIGKNSWVGPSSSIMNKISLADGVFIGLGAVVLKDVLPNTVMVGNPAKPLLKK